MSDEPELPPELRDLEATLRNVRPIPLREDLRDRLKATPSTGRFRFLPWLAAAAVLLGAITTFRWLTRTVPKLDTVASPPVAMPDVAPTWMAYTRAWSESPEALDRLLAAHDRRLLQPAPNMEKDFTD
jgi:hypothetical protein